jgi:hypothetical protein
VVRRGYAYLARREPSPMGAGRARERLCRTGELRGLLEMLSDISWIPESITSRKTITNI